MSVPKGGGLADERGTARREGGGPEPPGGAKQTRRLRWPWPGGLAVYNNIGGEHPCRQRWYPVTNLGAAGLLVAAAAASGLTAADLGLTAGQGRAGLRGAAGPAAALAAAWLTLAAVPASRRYWPTSGSPA